MFRNIKFEPCSPGSSQASWNLFNSLSRDGQPFGLRILTQTHALVAEVISGFDGVTAAMWFAQPARKVRGLAS